MARVRSRDTAPELVVRRAAHAIGLRFRLHRRDLPGRPDLIFPRYRLVLFVHGCYWHRHSGCRRATSPKTNTLFWEAKFAANIARDRAAIDQLAQAGWRTLVIWECETRHETEVKARLLAFLSPAPLRPDP